MSSRSIERYFFTWPLPAFYLICFNINNVKTQCTFNVHRVCYSTRLSLLGQDLRFAKHWLLPALHLCSAKPLEASWLSRLNPGSLGTLGKASLSRGIGLSKTNNSSTCGISLSLEKWLNLRLGNPQNLVRFPSCLSGMGNLTTQNPT